jgi:hypothetical protein
MDEDLFPSGPWTGFYNYTGPEDRHRMDLLLTFESGRMTGDGTDNVGPFLIAGRYDATTRECDWVKNYPGSHNVFYRGFRDGHGIWGTWEIPPFAKGGFHIWPKRAGVDESVAATAGAEQRIEAFATEDGQIEIHRPGRPADNRLPH